jgi:hypothetical protein
MRARQPRRRHNVPCREKDAMMPKETMGELQIAARRVLPKQDSITFENKPCCLPQDARSKHPLLIWKSTAPAFPGLSQHIVDRGKVEHLVLT